MAQAAAFKKAIENTVAPKKKASKKKEMPTVDNAPAAVKEAVDDYVEAKGRFDEAKADMGLHGGIVIDHVEEHQENAGFAGDFSKSYKVHGETADVKFISSNKYSLNLDDEAEIKKILGSKFSKLIEEVFDTQLRPEVMENEDLQNELLELIGEENFAKFFTTTKSLRVVDDYDKKVYVHLNKKKKKLIDNFVKRAKPSLRV